MPPRAVEVRAGGVKRAAFQLAPIGGLFVWSGGHGGKWKLLWAVPMTRPSRRLALLPTFIVLVCAGLACAPAAPADPDAVPTLTGKSLDGEYWSLEDARGKVVLVNVWAT